MLATKTRDKRADKAKKTEMIKNLDERTALLTGIIKHCESMSGYAHKQENRMEQDEDMEIELQNREKMQRLGFMWGRHGYLLSETAPYSDIDTSLFFDALVPSLQKADSQVTEFIIQNFEAVLDLAGDSLIPLVRGIQAKIKHYVYEQPQFYTMMALLCGRYGRYLLTHLELDNYLEDFEKERTPEALDFFAVILRVHGPQLKQESLIRLLNLMLKCQKLKTNRRYVRCLNEFFPLRFTELPLEEAINDLLKHTKGRIFTDPEFVDELEKFHLLSKSISFGF